MESSGSKRFFTDSADLEEKQTWDEKRTDHLRNEEDLLSASELGVAHPNTDIQQGEEEEGDTHTDVTIDLNSVPSYQAFANLWARQGHGGSKLIVNCSYGEDTEEEYSEERENFNVLLLNLDTGARTQFLSFEEFIEMITEWRRPGKSIQEESHPFNKMQHYWADVFVQSNQTQSKLDQVFKIHPLTSEDIFDRNKAEKVDFFEHYLYVVFNERFYKPGTNIEVHNDINFILHRDYILTIHVNRVGLLPKIVYQLQYGTDHGPSLSTRSPDWVLYKYLDVIVDEFFPLVTGVESEVTALDTLLSNVTSISQSDMLLRIGQSKKRIESLSHELLIKKTTIGTLATDKCKKYVKEDIHIFLGDVNDHINILLQRLLVADQRIQNLNSTYLAMLSIAIAESANQGNIVMKRFSAVATIVLPLTLIAGIWGMNVQVPFELGQTCCGSLWFLLILIGMLAYAVGMFLLFRKRNWL